MEPYSTDGNTQPAMFVVAICYVVSGLMVVKKISQKVSDLYLFPAKDLNTFYSAN